jgi:hypothetical protein
MFTRVVEINAKSGKASELAKAIQEKVLPILKKQTGFMDETVLICDFSSFVMRFKHLLEPADNRVVWL